MRNYPAGSLLFLKHDGTGFQIREFADAPSFASNHKCNWIVLDGQQRLTSLYQAFFGKGAHRFFVDLKVLFESDEIEQAVFHESARRVERRGLDQLEVQAEKLICPLSVIMAKDGSFYQWIDDIMEFADVAESDLKEFKTKLRRVCERWMTPILDYNFPVITLDSNTPLDAVCKMFETLNRRGVKLTVFELLMARAYSENVSLRNLWEKACSEFQIIEEFEIDPYYILQSIGLVTKNTIKRSDVLELDAAKILEHWNDTVRGFADSLAFIRKNLGVLGPKLIPYNTMLVPLAAIWRGFSGLKGPEITTAKEKLATWFWTSVFGQTYEKGPSSQAVIDYRQVRSWIFERGDEPKSVQRFYFNTKTLYDVTPKQRALYRGTLAIINSKGITDFHNGERLTFDYLMSNRVDDHHVFPQSYLKKQGVNADDFNCVLNRTLIDKKTNIRISDKDPSKYLAVIQDEIGEPALRRILESHALPIAPLFDNDFESFIEERANLVMDLLKERLGRDVPQIPQAGSDEEEEDEQTSDMRSKLSPDDISPMPVQMLETCGDETKKLFDQFVGSVNEIGKDIWWRVTKTRVAFHCPRKVFLTLRLRKSGLHLRIFTRGDHIEHVEPISQGDGGGALWGRIKVKKKSEMQHAIEAVHQAVLKMEAAEANGENTGWWAQKAA